jgi:hypothetical protein
MPTIDRAIQRINLPEMTQDSAADRIFARHGRMDGRMEGLVSRRCSFANVGGWFG